MNDEPKHECFFTKKPSHRYEQNLVFYYDSTALGKYAVSHELFSAIPETDRLKMLDLTFYIAKFNKKHQGSLKLFFDSDEKNQSPKGYKTINPWKFSPRKILHSEKPGDILKTLYMKVQECSPFSEVRLSLFDQYAIGIRDQDEFAQWLYELLDRDLISGIQLDATRKTLGQTKIEVSNYPVSLTIRAFELLENDQAIEESIKAFIAVAFSGNEQLSEIQIAIEAACEKCGFNAQTVAKKETTGESSEYLGRIDDKIFSDIHKSRFVIAELSLDNSGAYYEAGYAEGLGIPVIYMAKKSVVESKDGIHFDLKTMNFIVWEDNDFQDLEEKLINRINKTIRLRS